MCCLSLELLLANFWVRERLKGVWYCCKVGSEIAEGRTAGMSQREEIRKQEGLEKGEAMKD